MRFEIYALLSNSVTIFKLISMAVIRIVIFLVEITDYKKVFIK